MTDVDTESLIGPQDEWVEESITVGQITYVRSRQDYYRPSPWYWYEAPLGARCPCSSLEVSNILCAMIAEREAAAAAKTAAENPESVIAAVNKAMDERLAYLQAQITHAEGRIVAATRYNARFGNAGSARNQLDTVMHECTVALAQMEGARAMKSDVLIDLAKITGTAVDGGTPK